jgi:HEAT repeat protein/rubredoxin
MKIEKLRELAKHGNGHMRRWAVRRLGFLGGSGAVCELVNTVSDPYDEVAVQACIKLRDYLPEDAVEPLIGALSCKNPKVAANAAITLGAIGDTRAVEPLMELLRSPESSIRGAAASALGSFKQVRVENILLELLNVEEDWYVSIEVIKSLGRLRCLDALGDMVKEMLSAQDTVTHDHVLRALADFVDFRDIYSRIKSRDMALEVFDSVLSESARRAPPEAKKEAERFKDVLATKDAKRLRRRLYEEALHLAKDEIGWRGAEGPDFYHRLEDYDDVLCACMMLLQRFSGADIDDGNREWVEARNVLAISAFLRMIIRTTELAKGEEDGAEEEGRSASKLIEELKGTDEERPAKLVHALLQRGSEVEEELIEVLKMDMGYPSRYAAEVLGRMGSVKAIPDLIKALDSGDWTLAGHASDALGRIGEPSQDALEEYLKGGEEGRIYASSALALIGGDRALKVLLSLLEEPRGIPKYAIVADLAEMGDARAIDPLRRLMHSDPSYEVRGEAKAAVLDLCRMYEIEVPELKELEAELEESEKKMESIPRSGIRGRSPLADLLEPLEGTWHEPIPRGKKVGRNDPCPCGSGRKYKKCCGRRAGKGGMGLPRGELVKELYDQEPLSLVFRCRGCGWEYETVAGTAMSYGGRGDHRFYFEREIRCPKCESNRYEFTTSAYIVLTAELALVASEGERRKARGQEPPSGTSKLRFISKGLVDGKPMLPEEGVEYYKRKIEGEPQNARYYNRLGNLLRFINEYDEAIEAYEKSLEINPDLVESLHTLGEIYLDRGELERARGYLERAKASIEYGAPLLEEGVSREAALFLAQESLLRCLHGMEERRVKAERESERREHCISCGKPTRSHPLNTGGYLCHGCWVKKGGRK